MSYNLLNIGFTKNEYIKSDERIWYLKIHCNNSTILDVENRHSNYVDSFELQYGNIKFSSQFHPLFDGSKDIVVPIKGINHEFKFISQDEKTNSVKSKTKDYDDIYGHLASGSRWAVVYAVATFAFNDNNDINSVVATALILGLEREHDENELYTHLGLIDFGWNVIYCMDEGTKSTPLSTCLRVSDDDFDDMIAYANPKVGSGDELLIYVSSHGSNGSNGHYTWSHWTIGTDLGTYKISLSEYKNAVDTITSDGTFVFMWINACNGYGFDEWSSNYHNNKLHTWCFTPLCCFEVPSCNYDSFFWYDNDVWHYHEFLVGSYFGEDIDEIAPDAKSTYDAQGADELHYYSYWQSYTFRIRKDIQILNFEQFFIRDDDDNADIDSSKSASQISFSYNGGGQSGIYLNERYILTFAETSANFYIEITSDWSIEASRSIWHSFLNVGCYNQSTGSFVGNFTVGTRDSWSGNTGYFRSYANGIWHNTYNYNEVGYSRSDVNYIIKRVNGIVSCYIKQGSTILYSKNWGSQLGNINSIQFRFMHHTSYYWGTTSWSIDGIDSSIYY